MDPKVILAELCSKAPPEVRICIRKFNLDSRQDTKSLAIPFNTVKADQLIATLKYLKTPDLRPDLTDYTKSGLVFSLITRIQALFVETCSSCNTVYRAKFDEPALLSCASCSQEAHHQCLSEKLGIPLDNLTKDVVTAALNPFNMEEWTYICKPCKLNCHNDGDVKKAVLKAEAKKKKEGQATAPSADGSQLAIPASSSAASVNIIDGTEISSNAANDDSLDANDDSLDAHTQLDQQQYNPILDPSTIIAPDPNPLAENPPNAQQSANVINDNHSDVEDICQDHLTLSCKYGRSGDGCTFLHPKLCQQIMSHGDKAPDGCDGISCNFIHPRMCNRSLSKTRKCFYADCQYINVKGTIRKCNQGY